MRTAILLIVLMFACSVARAFDYCADDNNVGCFLMEDDGNETDRSTVATGGDLTVSAGDTIPQSADKKFGDYSRDFEADDQERLSHADNLATDINGANANLTVCGWHKPEGLGAIQHIAGKYASAGGLRQYVIWFFDTTNKRYAFSLSNSSADQSAGDTLTGTNTTVAVGNWYHVCGVYNDTDMRLYVNGQPDVDALAKTDGIYPSAVEFSVGSRGGGGTFYVDGLIDDVAVFSRALSPTEIADIYANGLVGSATPPTHTNQLLNGIWYGAMQ